MAININEHRTIRAGCNIASSADDIIYGNIYIFHATTTDCMMQIWQQVFVELHK